MSLDTDKTVEGTAPSAHKINWYVVAPVAIILVLLLAVLRVWVFNTFANQPPSDTRVVGASTAPASQPSSAPSPSSSSGGPPALDPNAHSAALTLDPSVSVVPAVDKGDPGPILDHIWAIVHQAEQTKNTAYLTHAFVFADEPLYLQLKSDIENGKAIAYPALSSVQGSRFSSGVYTVQFDSTLNGTVTHYAARLIYELDRDDWAVIDYVPTN